MPVQKLREFLNQNGVKYVTISHSPAFTAQEIAAQAHVKGHDMAKTVMVKLDDEMAMAVLPASYQVDLEQLRAATGARRVKLASEQEFKGRFPQCEAGAMPPFGNLWGMEVFADAHLCEDETITFNAGSHTELVKLSYAEYERLVRPRVASLTTRN